MCYSIITIQNTMKTSRLCTIIDENYHIVYIRHLFQFHVILRRSKTVFKMAVF
jgi:hypothetical protein